MDPNNSDPNQTTDPATPPQTDTPQTDTTPSDADPANPPQAEDTLADSPMTLPSDTSSGDTNPEPPSLEPQSINPTPVEEPQTDPTQTPVSTELSSPADPAASMQTDAVVEPTIAPDSQTVTVAPQMVQDAQQGDTPVDQPASESSSTSAGNSYIEDVGEDLIDLLDEISGDENLLKAVAEEMQLEQSKVKEILTSLLTKIDQGQVTSADLALIMASTVADEVVENQ